MKIIIRSIDSDFDLMLGAVIYSNLKPFLNDFAEEVLKKGKVEETLIHGAANLFADQMHSVFLTPEKGLFTYYGLQEENITVENDEEAQIVQEMSEEEQKLFHQIQKTDYLKAQKILKALGKKT